MCTICGLAQAFASKRQTAPKISARRVRRVGISRRRGYCCSGRPEAALADTSTAEVKFVNGKVYAVDAKRPWAQAVAVKGKRIAYVGDTAGAKAFISRRTEVIDLGGKMLMPGFCRGTYASVAVGSTLSQGVDLQYDTREKILEVLAAYAKTISHGSLVRGFGWRYMAFPLTGPRKEDLSTRSGLTAPVAVRYRHPLRVGQLQGAAARRDYQGYAGSRAWLQPLRARSGHRRTYRDFWWSRPRWCRCSTRPTRSRSTRRRQTWGSGFPRLPQPGHHVGDGCSA